MLWPNAKSSQFDLHPQSAHCGSALPPPTPRHVGGTSKVFVTSPPCISDAGLCDRDNDLAGYGMIHSLFTYVLVAKVVLTDRAPSL